MEVQRWKAQTWLDSKLNQYGSVKLPSGLIYKKISSRYFGKSPVPKSTCVCHYIGSLYSGEVFDSSYERGEPISITTTDVIPGWTEALQLMKEGEKWELYIPSNLAYGEAGQEPFIPKNCSLMFVIELLKVEGEYKKNT